MVFESYLLLFFFTIFRLADTAEVGDFVLRLKSFVILNQNKYTQTLANEYNLRIARK